MRPTAVGACVLVALGSAGPLFSQKQPEERLLVVKPEKLVMLNGGALTVEGRWRLIGRRNPNFSLARVNSSWLECSRETKTCEEETAELRTPEDGQRLGMRVGDLLATCHSYEVTEWTEDYVVAVSRKAVADLVVSVNVKERTAERTFRERKDPTQFSGYVLE